MKDVGAFIDQDGRERYFRAYTTAMRECPAPDAVLDVDTRHGVTRVYRFGRDDGPPIVLLPGLMATSACYGPLLPAFAARHAVYAIDPLGEAGRSVQTEPFSGVPDRARWLDDVLEGLQLTDVHLVGGSTGGWHAINQAIHEPGRIASVVMLDPTTVTGGFSWRVIGYGLAATVLNRDWSWRRFLRWSAGADILDRPDVQLVVAGIRSYRARVPLQVCPADDDIASVKVPVLAIFGGRSVVHDPAVAADRLRVLLPSAEVETLPEAGHYLFMLPEDRATIVERVLGFVARIGP